MTFAGGWTGALIASIALAGSPAAVACGYHDPITVGRGMLNWVYPNALYVTAAVWAAQRDGILARNEQPQAAQRLLGYQRTVAMLGMLRDRLTSTLGTKAASGFSMVLIGPMLWSRFEPSEAAVSMTAHIVGPAKGQVVIVSDEPVIAGLLDGRVTPAAARDLGLMRLYGPPERVQELTAWLDRLQVQSRADATRIGP